MRRNNAFDRLSPAFELSRSLIHAGKRVTEMAMDETVYADCVHVS
ncbi:hypothetical protein [Natronocalculus amylovorans]|nr:hypothetical protein [Natronocalculus amylovorans]